MSLRDPQARAWLDQAYPEGWTYRPYLVTADGDRVQVSSGLGMALRLGWLLGPRKAWRVWNLARQYGVFRPGDAYSAERRGFLKRATLFMAGLFFFPQLGRVSDRRPLQELDGNLIVQELRGKPLAGAVQMALEHKDGQTVKNFFAAYGYQPRVENSTGVKVEARRDGHQVIVITIPFENGIELGKMVFVSGSGTVRAGAGLIEVHDEMITAIDVYEVHDGSMQYVGRLERTPDGGIVVRRERSETQDEGEVDYSGE